MTVTVLSPDGTTGSKKVRVMLEHNLVVLVNERPAYHLVCTKDCLKELVAGRLLTDGIIERKEDIYKIILCSHENEASVFLNKEAAPPKEVVKDPTCCTGNRAYIESAEKGLKKLPGLKLQPDRIFELSKEFAEGARLHDLTGATHICILAGESGVLFKCEDIGRHNAVDKAVGYALLNGIDLSRCMLFTSGRVPVDMAEKVIRAGIPVLVSKSVPTADSVEMANKYGLKLICKAWPDRCEIYTGIAD